MMRNQKLDMIAIISLLIGVAGLVTVATIFLPNEILLAIGILMCIGLVAIGINHFANDLD